MSFTWKAPKRLRTPGEVARVCLEVAKARGLDEFAAVLAVMCIAQESDFWCPANENDDSSKNYDHDSLSDDGRSVGYLQQQNGRAGDTLPPGDRDDWWGPMASRMDLRRAVDEFYDRLAGDYRNAVASPVAAAQFIQRVQRSYWNGRTDHPGYYGKHWDRAWALIRGLSTPAPVDTVTPIVTAPTGVTPMPQVGDPRWLFDVLKADGQIDVVALDGWLDSGHGDFKDIRGVVWHHTGNDRESAQSIRRGRSDLPGPLSNLHIAKDGTVTVVAAGVCWHAGTGSYPFLPANMANWHMIGIECAWPPIAANGSYDEHAPWPRAQVLAMRNVAAALSRKMGLGVDRHIDHKEWAGRAQGKWDRGNMSPDWFRGEVAKDLAGFQFPGEGTVEVTPMPVPPPVPPVDRYANVLLYRGIVNHADEVRTLQVRLKRNYSTLVVDGDFGPHTERCVRDFQLTRRPPLAGDGIVGPATAAALQLTL